MSSKTLANEARSSKNKQIAQTLKETLYSKKAIRGKNL